MNKEDKHEITLATTVKAVITGYVAYGILIGFVAYMIGIVVNYYFASRTGVDMRKLSITLPLIEAIFIYFIVRGICKLSIHDVFKKCKTNPENMPRIHARLNLFVMIVIAVYVVASITILHLDFKSKQESIVVSSYRYQNLYSENFAEELTNKMQSDFKTERENTIISMVIIEVGMIFSLFSVIPLQRKVIDKENEV